MRFVHNIGIMYNITPFAYDHSPSKVPTHCNGGNGGYGKMSPDTILPVP